MENQWYYHWHGDGERHPAWITRRFLPPFNPTTVGSTLYFRANDGSNGTELWKSNGTNVGTVLVNTSTPERKTALRITSSTSSYANCRVQRSCHALQQGAVRRQWLYPCQAGTNSRRFQATPLQSMTGTPEGLVCQHPWPRSVSCKDDKQNNHRP